MKKYFLRDWADVRKQGFWSFVIIKGVIVWGGFLFIFVNLFLYLTSTTNETTYTGHWLVTQLAIWGVTGFLWGTVVWRTNEVKLKK
jgi:hypothetical protein